MFTEKIEMIFLFLDFNQNIASHRLRLLPFQRSIGKTGNAIQSLIKFESKFSGLRSISLLINCWRLLRSNFLVASKPNDKKSFRFIKAAKILGKKVIIDVSDNHLLNKNFDKKSTGRFLKILELADLITVPTFELRDSLPDNLQIKTRVIEDAIDELCLPAGSFDDEYYNFKVLWFGHAGWEKIRPGPSESLELFISHMSHPLFKKLKGANRLVEFYIVSNAVDRVREYLSLSGVSEKVFVSPWSIDAMKKYLSECNLVFLPYGITNNLDLTKSANRLELAVQSRKAVLTNRFFSHWDRPLRDYVYVLKDESSLLDFERYMCSVKDNFDDARKYLSIKQDYIIASWVRLIDDSVRYKCGKA